MIVYAVGPIDHWDGWMTLAEFLAQRGDETLIEKIGFLSRAMEEAKTLGWEGDIREGPYVAGLPPHEGDYFPNYMIAWKQNNNGTTFVASPIELPWLR